MGKSKPGLFTPVSGKIGGVVYYYRNGKQRQRILVTPSNPKSASQTATRLKFALSGRINGIVPAEALEGMSGENKIRRRSAFTSNLILNSTVVGSRASIDFNNVVFSEGSLGVLNGHTVAAAASLTTRRSLTVTVNHGTSEPELPDGYGERYVVLCVNTETSQFDYCETGLLNMPESVGGSATTTVSVRIGDKVGEYLGLVYVVPFMARAECGSTSSSRYSYIGTEDGTLVVDMVTGETVGRPEVFGLSQYINSVTLLPPTQG